MPTIRIRFPGGRYHATPWGSHVNEGHIEWPPSPWRLLRAFIASGYSMHSWIEVPPVGRRLIETLASVLPTYQLPSASAAHSRHYMPTGTLKKGVEKTTLVFDTWANVGDGELLIRWDCNLDAASAELFESLVHRLGYLGRSESWVEGSVIPDYVAFTEQQTAFPHSENHYPGPEWEQVPLMASALPETYSAWRHSQTEPLLVDLLLPEGKKKPSRALLNKRAKVVDPYPEDLLACLQKDTVWWKKQHRWSQPPGSQRVHYWRRIDSLVVSAPVIHRTPIPEPVTTILLSLITPSRNKAALPQNRRTLPQAELFHRAIVGRVGKGRKVHCPELTGKDQQGKPLCDGHRHAHILPLDLDADGHLDHVLVYAPMGLRGDAQRAIRALKRTWTKGGVGDLQVAIVGCGSIGCLRKLPDPLNGQVQRLLGPTEGTQTWTSATPFVAPRFLKKHGKNSLAGQVNAEFASRGLPAVTEIELLPYDTETLDLRHFVKVRRHGGTQPPHDNGYGLRIHLTAPITGPLVLGYGAHFGLGLFFAAD